MSRSELTALCYNCIVLPQKPTVHLIVNPTAGRGAAAKQLPSIVACLTRLDCVVQSTLTTERGHARRIAEESIAIGTALVVAVGGDGTLHEVSNAVMDSDPSMGATLGLMACGTGNDFARCVGLTGSIEHMCDVIANGRRTFVDVGVIEGVGLAPTRFLVAAGTGYIADTAKTVNRGIRYVRGMPAYLIGAVQTLASFHSTQMTLTFDNLTRRNVDTMLVSVSNVATTGGGMKIAPGARCDDGKFEVCLVRKLSKWVLLSQLPNVINGTHVTHPAVEMLAASKVVLQSDVPLDLWIDGEVLGTTPANITMEPGRLPILLPN
jgi:diacylglycerol kinase (ATP)